MFVRWILILAVVAAVDMFAGFPARAADSASVASTSIEHDKSATPGSDQSGFASPLAPVPDDSPRQAFATFRTLVRQAEGSLLGAIKLAAASVTILDTPRVSALKRQALDDLSKAASTLDLSAVPPESRRTVGISSVLLLNEILERIPLPDLEDIPGPSAAVDGWTVPGTEIRLTRSEGPDGKPRFQFSSDTVRRLEAFYSRVRDLPRHSGNQTDFYQSFVLGPGLSTPMEFYHYVLKLPAWMRVNYYEQAVWQWIGFAILTVMIGVLIFLLFRWEGRRQQPSSTAGRSMLRMITPLVIIALLAGYLWLNDNFINLTGGVLASLEIAVLLLQAVALGVAIVLAFNAVAALIVAMPNVRADSLDASLIWLVLRVLGILVAGYVFSLAASRAGVPLYGIIASLGVGGLALALAVRPTLENLVAGIMLYADRPVNVGDFCKFGDMLGIVEAIGLRSTKVRRLDRTLVTIQNAEFAQMSITNFSRRDSNLMHTTIDLRYETTKEQLSAVIEGIADMLRADDRVNGDSVRVCLLGFGDYSLNVEIWAYVNCADWGQFLKIQEDLLMKIIAIVQDSGTAFALPSQTTYVSPDKLAGGAPHELGPLSSQASRASLQAG